MGGGRASTELTARGVEVWRQRSAAADCGGISSSRRSSWKAGARQLPGASRSGSAEEAASRVPCETWLLERLVLRRSSGCRTCTAMYRHPSHQRRGVQRERARRGGAARMLRWTLGRTSWDRLRVRSTLGSPLVENANFVVSLYLGQTRLLRKHWEELVTHAALHLEAVAPRSRRGFSVPLGAWPQYYT